MLENKLRIRIHHLQEAKKNQQRFIMLTAYDQYTAEIFDEANVPLLLVGDSAANNVLGFQTTIPITLDEIIPLCRSVSKTAKRALVVADLPFGSYETNSCDALRSAIRLMKEGYAHAVKLEGGNRSKEISAIVNAGIPVMGHIGFTPQSEHALGGYRVQGRGENENKLISEALAIQSAGAFAIVLEMIPTMVAKKITETLNIPTIGIGAGPHTDGQVLVWQDMAGMSKTKPTRFVKQYTNLRTNLTQAAKDFAHEVNTGQFPAPEHSFEQ